MPQMTALWQAQQDVHCSGGYRRCVLAMQKREQQCSIVLCWHAGLQEQHWDSRPDSLHSSIACHERLQAAEEQAS